MAMKLTCKCGAALVVKPEMAGKIGTCPKCGAAMRIPKAFAQAKPPGPAAPVEAVVAEAAPKPQPAPSEPFEAPVAEAAPAQAAGQVLDAEIVEAGAEEEAPLYPVNIRWPSSRLLPMVFLVVGVLILLGVAAAAIFWLPKLINKPVPPPPPQAEAFVNKTYGYSLTIPPDWNRTAESNDDKVIILNDNGKARATFEVKDLAPDKKKWTSKALMEAISADAAKDNPQGEKPKWANRMEIRLESNGVAFEMKYEYAGEGGPWRAVYRLCKLGDKWLLVTFREPTNDDRNITNGFDSIYSSFQRE